MCSPKLEEKELPESRYIVTGVTRTGHRFRVETESLIHALGINLWKGTVWEIVEGHRKKIRTVSN